MRSRNEMAVVTGAGRGIGNGDGRGPVGRVVSAHQVGGGIVSGGGIGPDGVDGVGGVGGGDGVRL